MNVNLIPFALRRHDQQIVSVDDVERGLASDCVCPSCGLPLVARKSDSQIKAPHFAHHTRGHQVPDKECDFSFAVSVRLMMHQLSTQGKLEFKTPRLDKTRTTLSIEQCQSRLIDIENLQVDVDFEGVPVDMATEVKGHKLIIYLTHKGRRVPESLRHPKDNKCGIISLDVDGLEEQFDSAENVPYLSILNQYLKETESHRLWVFNRFYTLNTAPLYTPKPAGQSAIKKAQRTEPLSGQALSDELMKIGLSMRSDSPRWSGSNNRSGNNSYKQKKSGD